jgi:hypothetical protein
MTPIVDKDYYTTSGSVISIEVEVKNKREHVFRGKDSIGSWYTFNNKGMCLENSDLDLEEQIDP